METTKIEDITTADDDTRYVPDQHKQATFCSIAHESRYEWFSEHFDLANKTIVDFGSGSGYGANFLAPRAKSVLGIDISSTAVDYANRIYGKANTRFIARDLEDRNLPRALSQRFDYLVSFDVIEHVERFFDFAQNSSELIQDDGVAVIGCPNRLETFTWNSAWNEFHMQEFTPIQLQWLLRHYYKDVEMLGQDFIDSATKAKYVPAFKKAKYIQIFIPQTRIRMLLKKIPFLVLCVRQIRAMRRTSNRISSKDIAFIQGDPDSEALRKSFGLIAICRAPIRR